MEKELQESIAQIREQFLILGSDIKRMDEKLETHSCEMRDLKSTVIDVIKLDARVKNLESREEKREMSKIWTSAKFIGGLGAALIAGLLLDNLNSILTA